ncbi:hypothetical protein LZ32DRAFT_687927 [Colletotrichum eremochloae]|nr:hypothetical protein LZ32DRAFT_687927 [Colletotrichum eremochloae]
MRKVVNLEPLASDLVFMRVTSLLLVIGTVAMAVASASWAMVVAFIMLTMGSALTVVCRALLNVIVEPHFTGALNTIISWVELVSLLISATSLSQMLKKGLDLGGLWIGMPWIGTLCMAVGGSLIAFLYRLPAVAVAEES